MYSLFAILIMGLTLSITTASFETGSISQQGQKLRIDEVSYFMNSITDDLDRATEIIGRRALTAVTNRVVNEGVYINRSEAAYRFMYINGTWNGSFSLIMNRSTALNWTTAMREEAADAGYDLTMNVTNLSVGIEDHMHITLNASYHVNLSDPVSDATFNRNVTVRRTVSYDGIEDPIILVESVGRYANTYKNCSTATPARQHGAGTDRFYDDVDNWTSGEAVTRPGNGGVSGVSNKGEKVAVVNDLCSYADMSDFSSFAGVVSEEPAIDNTVPNNQLDACGENDVGIPALIDDADGATNITQSAMTVMTEDELWQNNMGNWTANGCYFDDPWAPSFWERIKGKFERSDYPAGPAFFVTVPDLPQQLQETNTSAIGYVYFGDTASFGEEHKIKGVTNEGRSWFRIDQDHIDHWNLNSLSYD